MITIGKKAASSALFIALVISGVSIFGLSVPVARAQDAPYVLFAKGYALETYNRQVLRGPAEMYRTHDPLYSNYIMIEIHFKEGTGILYYRIDSTQASGSVEVIRCTGMSWNMGWKLVIWAYYGKGGKGAYLAYGDHIVFAGTLV